MPGKQFDPSTQSGPFVGLIFITSSRGITTLPGRIVPQVSAGASALRASGRSFNGHTALIAGIDGRITDIVGWDPESSVQAAIGSMRHGYAGMAPLRGAWGDDVGMDADPSALYFGTSVDMAQYAQFRDYIRHLIGRNDFGEATEGAGIQFSYSFNPNGHMQQLEESNIRDSMRIVANCGDAAFHVLATFFYEWRMASYVETMRSYILQSEASMNFSQGLLMRWAKAA